MNRVLTLAFLVVAISMECLAQDYGAYGLSPQGSGRVMAIGGASASLSQKSASIHFNPAASTFEKWTTDFNGTNNKVDNTELEYNFPDTYGVYETKYDAPYSYLYYSAATKMGSWVFGMGVSAPFYYEYVYVNPYSNNKINWFEVKMTSVDVMLAKQFGSFFSLGITAHQENLTEYYQNLTLPGVASTGLSTKGKGQHVTYGAQLDFGGVAIGVHYRPQRYFEVDKSNNQYVTMYNEEPFRNVIIPGKMMIGSRLQFGNSTTFYLDWDRTEAPFNTIYVSAITTSYEYFVHEVKEVLHGGIEYIARDAKNFGVILRGGGYREPTRFANGKPRDHITLGMEIKIGPAILIYSMDRATGFNNSAQGISLSTDFI